MSIDFVRIILVWLVGIYLGVGLIYGFAIGLYWLIFNEKASFFKAVLLPALKWPYDWYVIMRTKDYDSAD